MLCNTLDVYDSFFLVLVILLYSCQHLCTTVIGSLKDIKPPNWCLSKDYLQYLQMPAEETWIPEQEYYIKLVGRVVDSILVLILLLLLLLLLLL